MPYCPNCGAAVNAGANFCPTCGANMATASTVNTSTASSPIYRVILVNKGTCTKTLCKEVLRDLMGYTATNAGALVDAMPVEIARNLTRDQAIYISQVLTEYGMETAICDNRNSYVDLNRYAVNSVFNDSGSFLAEAAAVLGTITVLNQVNNVARWNQPNPLSFLFRPAAPRRNPPPPKNRWNSIFGTRQPAPPRPAPQPARAPQPPRPAPQPARGPQPKPQVPNPPSSRAPSVGGQRASGPMGGNRGPAGPAGGNRGPGGPVGPMGGPGGRRP